MEEIVRQATELGVAVIAPLQTARCEVRLEAERAERRGAKWRAGAIEAAKQCGNPWLPEITPVLELEEFLVRPEVAGAELRLLASLAPGARALRAVLAEARAGRGGRAPQSIVWLVGPEGDFTDAETARLIAAGCVPVSLGPLVLRCDTAAVTALGALRVETEG
jgi:16S rRNA (uracil1498-N3)-methyltransferase